MSLGRYWMRTLNHRFSLPLGEICFMLCILHAVCLSGAHIVDYTSTKYLVLCKLHACNLDSCKSPIGVNASNSTAVFWLLSIKFPNF